jgi:uncharacterized protein YcfJ
MITKATGRRITLLCGLAASLCLAGGCGPQNQAQNGAFWGAAIGAGSGAIIGHQSGHAGEGAGIGAAAGGLLGYILGNEADKQEAYRYNPNYDY